jgi:hypothetical protein
MATNKDIKELMEARKARRAIPQTDPAELVTQPSPESEAVEPPHLEEPPKVAPASELPTQPSSPLAGALELDDPRPQAPPPDDLYIPKTLKVKRHRDRQLRAEAYHRDMLMQDVLEVALGEYFTKRYGRQGGGQHIQP